ncbi:MAG: hypothetical protein RL607_1161 [Bacteroidota bacterium]|jgi:hypothetical protein
MKKLFPYLILIIFLGCKDSKIAKQKAEKIEFDKIDSVYFNSVSAKNRKFSLLIFGGGYFNSKLSVINCEEVHSEDSVKTLKLGPFAKIFRIDNSCKTSFTDEKRKHFLEFNADTVKKYKFIYVDRDLMTDSLNVIFRNTHLPEK